MALAVAFSRGYGRESLSNVWGLADVLAGGRSQAAPGHLARNRLPHGTAASVRTSHCCGASGDAMAALTRAARETRTTAGPSSSNWRSCFRLLLLIVAGIADFGFLFQRYEVVTNAAREGARLAVLPDDGYTDADVKQPRAELSHRERINGRTSRRPMLPIHGSHDAEQLVVKWRRSASRTRAGFCSSGRSLAWSAAAAGDDHAQGRLHHAGGRRAGRSRRDRMRDCWNESQKPNTRWSLGSPCCWRPSRALACTAPFHAFPSAKCRSRRAIRSWRRSRFPSARC